MSNASDSPASSGAVEVKCPGCGKRYDLPPEYWGHKVACPGCNSTFYVAASLMKAPAAQAPDTIAPAQGQTAEENVAAAWQVGEVILAHLGGNLILKDATDDHVIYTGEFSQLWAWGGALGASRGIEDMEADSVAAVANTIAAAKGWVPPAKASSGEKHPKYSDYRDNLPPVPAGRSRLWFYRQSQFSAALATFAVRLDGAFIGTAVNGGFFTADVEPGKHEVSVSFANVEKATIAVAGGNEYYIRVYLQPELVSEAVGVSEISKSRLKGN